MIYKIKKISDDFSSRHPYQIHNDCWLFEEAVWSDKESANPSSLQMEEDWNTNKQFILPDNVSYQRHFRKKLDQHFMDIIVGGIFLLGSKYS